MMTRFEASTSVAISGWDKIARNVQSGQRPGFETAVSTIESRRILSEVAMLDASPLKTITDAQRSEAIRNGMRS